MSLFPSYTAGGGPFHESPYFLRQMCRVPGPPHNFLISRAWKQNRLWRVFESGLTFSDRLTTSSETSNWSLLVEPVSSSIQHRRFPTCTVWMRQQKHWVSGALSDSLAQVWQRKSEINQECWRTRYNMDRDVCWATPTINWTTSKKQKICHLEYRGQYNWSEGDSSAGDVKKKVKT